ncbi:MAG TPA: hypothetical protein VGO66_08160 [Solirubrobacterales bacterium]|nr:hypothetical protein [Solirubrobacterales bacterium]
MCGASLAVGQAAIALCGQRRWSWLAPAVGLALICALCWATVRLPGDGLVAAIAVAILVVGSLVFLRGRVGGGREALRVGWPVALVALLATSLPFLVEGHFGILGTGFNPDMSQHLLATDRLAHGVGGQLLHQGYPLGPHAIVVALHQGLGIGLVQGFSGLTVAVAVLAPLTALTAFAPVSERSERSSFRIADVNAFVSAVLPIGAALVVGLAYVVASYFAQGAFKETMQALFVLAFVLALRESGRDDWANRQLRFLPAALIAVGSVYVYSFPGLIWLFAVLVIWLLLERALPLHPLLLGLLAFAVFVAPELGRMVDFHNFETFDPNGPGLGNLFGQVSPFEALGIWPSGDFRLAPGDGAVPAAGYYLGVAFALALLIYGVVECWRRRERAVLAGLSAVALAYLAARLGGTPYTAAKAIEVAAPIAALTILLPLLGESVRFSPAYRDKGAPIDSRAPGRRLGAFATALFLLGAGACSALALANAPVGPTTYSPALTGLRPLVAADSTLFLASPELLSEQQGASYIAWELRGGRVCITSETEAGKVPPPGVRFVVVEGPRADRPFPGLRVRRVAGPYVLWEDPSLTPGKSPCPLIAVRQARQAPAR